MDIRLQKNGQLHLVQCKQWRRRQVAVATVREMWGLLQHHKADAVWIVCIGEFTPDAAAFAAGKPIRLVTGRELGGLMQQVGASPAPAQTPPETAPAAVAQACPSCGGKLVARKNRRTGDRFLGCETYPACRGTAALR